MFVGFSMINHPAIGVPPFEEIPHMPYGTSGLWNVQDPKMEVLYYTRSYFVRIFPYIGLKNIPKLMVGASNKSVPVAWPLNIGFTGMIFLWYTRILKGLYQGEVPWMANVYRHFPTATSSERFKADHISESEVSKWIASYQRCPWEAKTTGLARATASDYYRCHYCSPSYNREVFVTVSWNKRINRKKVYPSCDCPGFAWRTNCFDNKPQLTTTYLPATILKVPSAQTFNHFQLAIRLAVSLTNLGFMKMKHSSASIWLSTSTSVSSMVAESNDGRDLAKHSKSPTVHIPVPNNFAFLQQTHIWRPKLFTVQSHWGTWSLMSPSTSIV